MSGSVFKKAVIYTRVSSEEQAKHDLSLPFQKKRCREYAKEHGFIIVEEFEEPGRSGTSAIDRPELMQMLKFSIDQKIDAVIIHKSDRLGRNMGDFWGMYNLWKSKGISILSVTENFDDSPAGLMHMGIMSASAQYYSANLSLEVKKGHTEKLDRGIWPGMAPFAYINYGPKHDRRIKPDKQLIDYVKKAFELYSTGNYSINNLHEALTILNAKTKVGTEVSRSILAKMLVNPIYSGPFYWKGVYHEKFEHKPIISQELYRKVKMILEARRQKGTRDRKYNFMTRGYVYCTCGAMLTGDKKTKHFKNGTSREYLYLCCKNTKKDKDCSKVYIRMEETEKLIQDVFSVFKFKPHYREYVIKTAKEIVGEVRNTEDEIKRIINQKITAIEKKMEKAEDERFEQTITREDFVRIYDRLKGELAKAQTELAKLSDNHTKTVKMLDEVIAMTENLYKAYEDAMPDLKRSYLGMFIDRILIDNKSIVQVVLTPIAQKLVDINRFE